jgi:hypothetical protein
VRPPLSFDPKLLAAPHLFLLGANSKMPVDDGQVPGQRRHNATVLLIQHLLHERKLVFYFKRASVGVSRLHRVQSCNLANSQLNSSRGMRLELIASFSAIDARISINDADDDNADSDMTQGEMLRWSRSGTALRRWRFLALPLLSLDFHRRPPCALGAR